MRPPFLLPTSTCAPQHAAPRQLASSARSVRRLDSLLVGAWWESLLSTYDIRGQGRQLVYLIIFILL